ncbi:hypothetical protein MAP00_006542 [Monascus purpureus]|nr:hypothetical protein MAP00_006542 [Monascus purpureus]
MQILSLLNGPVLTIQRQSNGEESDDDDDGDDKEGTAAEIVPIRIAERRYIAECAVRDPSVLRDQKGYAFHVECSVTLIALCKRRDRRQVTTRCSPEPASVKTALDSPRLSEREPIVKRDNPLKCQDWQCLFCLASYDLPLEERKRKYKRKYTLQKHVERCRLEYYGPDDPIPCPDGHACAGLILNGKNKLKAHFIHNGGPQPEVNVDVSQEAVSDEMAT